MAATHLNMYIDSKGIARIDKDPNADLDYVFRLTDWLGTDELKPNKSDHNFDDSAGITVEDWSVEADTSITPNKNNAVIRVWVSGGTRGQDNHVTLHFVTLAGREDDRTIVFNVREK